MIKKYTLGNQDVDTSFITLEMTWHGMQDKRIKEQIGCVHPVGIAEIIKGKTINYHIEAEKLSNFVKVCAKNILENKNLLDYLKRNTIKSTAEIRSLAKKSMVGLEHLNNKKLANLILKIKKTQAECMIYGTVVAWCDVHGAITNSVLEILNKRPGLRYPLSLYTKVLATPSEKSFSEKAYASIIKTKKPDKEVLHEYFWIDQGYIGRGLTIEQLEEIRRSHVNIDEDLPLKDDLLKELKLTEKEKRTFQVLKDVIKIKSLRADSRQFLNVIVNRIVDLLSKKWKIDSKYLESMYAEELANVLKSGNKLPENLKERWKHSVVTSDGKDYKILIGNEAKEFLKKHLVRGEIKNKEEVRGQIAHPGKVRGYARLVFTPQHNQKVRMGNILISTATSPQLLPSMKRAAGFVTDIGGITSHAAIVARELGKPCVVGTKHATQIFKDNDLIELDADRGVVRKLR